MSKYRLYPTPQQEDVLWEYCGHARLLWNLAWEQNSYYDKNGPRKHNPPTYNGKSQQLTELRAEHDWLRNGCQIVQQQALKDFNQAMQNFFNGTHKYPKKRKKTGVNGFRITHVKHHQIVRLNKRWGSVMVPKVGNVKFRWTRAVDANRVKSYRVTKDPSGRWHVAFTLQPDPKSGPNEGSIVGIDMGVVHMATTNEGKYYDFTLGNLDTHLKRAQRKLARCQKGSNRRKRQVVRVAKLHARIKDKRRDCIEKVTTEIAEQYDYARLENLNIRNMTKSAKGTVDNPGRNVRQKAGLNKVILSMGWGMFMERLEYKMNGRVEFVPAEYTSQRCNNCGYTNKKNRDSQAVFLCLVCGFGCNADVNAARNIADGLFGDSAVRILGYVTTPMKREPLNTTNSCA